MAIDKRGKATDKKGKDTYRIRIDIGRDESGKRMVYHETFQGTKTEAKAREAVLKLLYKTGRAVKNNKQTLNDFLVKDWFPTAAVKRRIRTMEEYKKLFERHIRPVLGAVHLNQLHPTAVQRFYNGLTQKGLSPRSVRNVHSVLHQALGYAVKMQLITFNPASGAELPTHQDQNAMRSFDPEQAQAFLQASRSHRIGIVFRFALETGTRPQEYCAVEWSDLNLETGAVSINKAMIWPRGGGYQLGPTKTPKSRRLVILSPTLVDDLRHHRTKQLEERLFLGQEWRGGEFIFTNTAGRPMNTTTLRDAFQSILKEAGLPTTFRVYDLRHTAATLLGLAKVSVRTIADRLGHSTTRLTLDTYSHVLPSMSDEAAEVMENVLHSGHILDAKTPKKAQSNSRKRR